MRNHKIEKNIILLHLDAINVKIDGIKGIYLNVYILSSFLFSYLIICCFMYIIIIIDVYLFSITLLCVLI